MQNLSEAYIRLVLTDKYSTDCPAKMVYRDKMTGCGHTCRSRNPSDITCQINFTSVDGCDCDEGTYLNEKGECVSASHCPCYAGDLIMHSGQVTKINGKTW